MNIKFVIILYSLIAMLSGVNLLASSNVDSLEKLLHSKYNSTNPSILNSLSEAYQKKNFEKSLDYAFRAYNAAVARNVEQETARALNNIGICYEYTGDYNKSLEYYQKALTLRLKSGNKSEIAQSYNNLGISYYNLNNYSNTLEYYRKSLELRLELGDKKEIAKSLNNLGIFYLKWKNYNKALEYRYRLLELVKESGEKSDIADLYSYIGLIYYNMGDYTKSIDYYIKELRIREQIGDLQQYDSFLTNLGKLYYSVHRYNEALEYYKKAISVIQKKGDKIKLAKAFLSIGNVYYEKNNYHEALNYYHKSLKLTEEKGSKKGRAVLLNNIGLIYKTLGDYQQALKYCLESIQIKDDIGDSSNIFYPLTSISEIYAKLNMYDQSISYLDKAIQLAYKDNQKNQIKSAYYLYFTTYSAMGNYKTALKYHLLYTDIKDTLITTDANKRIAELRVKYETERKEQENKALRKQNEIQRNYFLVISGLILILLAVIINRYRNKQKANIILQDMNKRINAQHVELERTYQQLQASETGLREANATKDKFFTIIAHDLRNPLQAIILSSDLLINKYKVMDGEQLIELINNINRSGNHLSNLLTNLLQWSRTQTGKIEYNPDIVILNSMVRDNINLLSHYAQKKRVHIMTDVDQAICAFADPNMTNTILRNLISNACKFTGTNGMIKIAAKIVDNMVEVSVSDTGIGLSKEDIGKLFRIDVSNTNIGSSSEKGTGLGLILCKEFVEINGGSIRVESIEGSGSTFTFTLPVHITSDKKHERQHITHTKLFVPK